METCPACSYTGSDNDFIVVVGSLYTFTKKDEDSSDIVPVKLYACPKCGCVKMVQDK